MINYMDEVPKTLEIVRFEDLPRDVQKASRAEIHSDTRVFVTGVEILPDYGHTTLPPRICGFLDLRNPVSLDPRGDMQERALTLCIAIAFTALLSAIFAMSIPNPKTPEIVSVSGAIVFPLLTAWLTVRAVRLWIQATTAQGRVERTVAAMKVAPPPEIADIAAKADRIIRSVPSMDGYPRKLRRSILRAHPELRQKPVGAAALRQRALRLSFGFDGADDPEVRADLDRKVASLREELATERAAVEKWKSTLASARLTLRQGVESKEAARQASITAKRAQRAREERLRAH